MKLKSLFVTLLSVIFGSVLLLFGVTSTYALVDDSPSLNQLNAINYSFVEDEDSLRIINMQNKNLYVNINGEDVLVESNSFVTYSRLMLDETYFALIYNSQTYLIDEDNVDYLSASLLTNPSFTQIEISDNSTRLGLVRSLDDLEIDSTGQIYFVYESVPYYLSSTGLTTDNSSLLKVSDNPVVTNYVFDGTKKVGLNSGTGYVRLGTYEAINAGTYKASAELKTNYIFEDGTSSKKELTWTIEPLDASSCDFEDIEDQIYTGQEINVDPVIKMNGLTLINGTDYDLSFENNINVGIATVNITFKGNYKGEASKDFNIVSKLVTSSSIRQIKDWTYTGSTPSLTPTVSFNSKILELGTDYEIDFSSNPVDVGTYEATVNFINNYKGSASFTYNIVPTNGALSIINYPNENLIYSGREIVPTLTVKLGSKVLESGVDYDLVLPENVIDAGLKVITIKYKGNYKGEQNVEYTISRCNGTDLHSQLSNESFVYDGSEHKPSVILTNGSNVLFEGTDYDLEYESDIVNAGTKDIYVYFKGNYQNTLTLNYEINPKDGDSNALWIETNQTSFVYNGSEQYPVIALYDSDRFTYLIENEDFFINYPEDLVSAGIKTILIEFDGNYSSTKEISYVITPISTNLVIHSISNQTYTGSYLTPDVQITHNNDLLVKGKDYDLSYSNNVNVGNASVYVSFKGNYSSNKITSFKIVPLLISEIDVDEADKIYTGSEIKASIHIEHNGYVLMEGTDYITTYSNNINVGHASLLITLMGNYEGEFARSFNIKSKNLSSNDVYIEPQFKYTGEEIKPNVRVLDGNYLLELNKDYTLTYSSDVISTGIKNVYITYIGNYEGSNQTTFEIVNRASVDIDCEVEDITYSGIYLMPTVTCKVEDNLLEEGRDYSLDYSSNLNVGTGKVIITFKGNYTGSKELSFKINQLDISNLVEINLSQDSFIYDEQSHSPTVEIRYNNKVLTYIQDYTLSYPSDLVSAGDKVINIVFKQNYTGSTSTTYKIVKTSIEPTTNIPETIRINSAYQIVFTSESTGKITYSSNNTSLLTIDEFGLISVNNILGKVILTINVEEDNNYSSYSKDYEIDVVLDKGFIINKDDINYGYDLLESALENLEDNSLTGVTILDKNIVSIYNKIINNNDINNIKDKYIKALVLVNNQDDLDDLDNRLDLLINSKNELLNRSNYIKYKDLYDASISELEDLDAIYIVEDLNNIKELVINKTDFNDLKEEKINYITTLKDNYDDEELIDEYKSNLNDLDYDINLSNILNNKKIIDLVNELDSRLNKRSIYKTDKANIRLNIEGLKDNHPLCISYINSKLEEFDNLVIDESKSNEENRLVLESFLSDVVTGIAHIEDLDNKTNLINNLKTDINNYTSSLIKTGKYNESKQDELNKITNKYIKQLDDLDLEMSLDDFNTNLLEIKTNYDEEIIIVDVSKVEEKTTYNNQDIDVVIINDDGIQNINNVSISLVDDSTTLSDKIVASYGNEVSDVAHSLVDKEVLMRLDINITEVIDESSLYRVEINLPNELKNREHLLVIYQRDDGTIEVYNTVVENDKLVFNTSHFSSFYILADQIVSLYWAIYLLSAVVVILLIAIILKIISDKKKRNNSSLYSISILPILVSQLIPNNALLIIVILSVLILILSAILVGLFVRSYSKDNDYVNASSRNKEIEESFTHVNLLKDLKNNDKQEETKEETILQEDQTEQIEEETTKVVQEVVEEEQIEAPQEHATEEVTEKDTEEVVEVRQEDNTEESVEDLIIQEEVEESTGNIEETDLVVQDEEPVDNVEAEETPAKEAQDSNEEIINNQEEVIDPDYELEEEPYIEEDENKVEQIQFDEDYELEEEPYIESLKLESVAVEEVDALMTDETAESMVETSAIIQDISHKSAINVDTLNKNFNDGDEIDIEKIKKVIKRFDRKATYVKVLGRGRIDKKLIITADEFSLDAVKMILLLGGRVIKTSKPVELVNEDIKEENKKSNLQRISLLEDDYTDVYEEQESINKSSDEDNYVSSNYEKMSLLDEDNPLIEEQSQEEIKEEPQIEVVDTNSFIDEVEPDNKDYEEYYYEEVPQHIKDYEEESEYDYEMYQQFFGEKSNEEQEESEIVEEDTIEEEPGVEETEELEEGSEENYEESIENEVEEPIVEESPTQEEVEEPLEETLEEPTEEVKIEEEVQEQVDDSNWQKLEIFDQEDSPLQDEYHEEVESVNVDYLNSIVNKEEHMENYEDYYNSQGEEESVEDINPVVTQEDINEYYEEYPLDNNESDNEKENKEEPQTEEVEQEQIEEEVVQPQEVNEVDTNSFIDEVEPDNEDYEEYYYEEVPQHIKDYEEESESDYEMYQQFFGEKSDEEQEESEKVEEETTEEEESEEALNQDEENEKVSEEEEEVEEEQVERRPLEEPSTTYNDDGKIVITSLLNNDDQTYEENSIREIREELPQLNEVSVEEVDKYMSDEVAESLVEYSSKKVDKTKKTVVNLDELSEYFEDGDEIDLPSMKKKIKKIDKKATYVKVLSRGKLDKRLIITADDFSLAAEKMILLLGGRVIRNK